MVSIIHSTDNREFLNPWGHAVARKWQMDDKTFKVTVTGLRRNRSSSI